MMKNYNVSNNFINYKLNNKKFKKLISFDLNNHDKDKKKLYSKVSIYDNILIEKFLLKQFKTKLKPIILKLEDEESTSSDLKVVLDETERLRSILRNIYSKYLSEEELKEYLSKINFVIKKIGIKIIQKEEKYINDKVYEEKVGKSR